MQIQKDLEKIVEEFELFDDWEEKYTYVIELGKKLPIFDDAWRVAENKVNGCVSNVWLVARKNGDKFEFFADSDAMIVRGLLKLLLRIFSGKTRQEILLIDIKNLFDRIGFGKSLTPTRSNGFFSVVERIKLIVQN